MRVLACPLIVALSVFVSCFFSTTGQAGVARAQTAGAVRGYRGQGKQRALKQSPGTVNIRSRVTAAQPGVPTVKVTVDRNRVPLGDEVTYTLTPASVVMDPRYIVTIYFGDGTSRRVRQTEIVYLYRATGTYTYSILVKAADPPAQDIPQVSLSAYPTPVATESPVTFTAQLSHSYPNIRYRFAFGDGNETQWQDAPRTTHAYKPAGKYLAYVDIGAISGGGVKPLGGSVRQPIEVISPPLRPIAVTLSANPRSVEVKQPATFFARVDSSEPNIRYRFDFGDRSGSTAWQVGRQTTHFYSERGTYLARVDVQVINSRSAPQTASSSPLQIEVRPAVRPPVTVDLIVEPESVQVGSSVFFRAITASANSNTRYRFNFGDSSPPGAWQDNPEDTHTYSLPGNYPAFVEVGSSSNEPSDATSASDIKHVRVERIIPLRAAPARVSPDNWWILLALLLLAGYQGWKYLKTPRPTLVPNVDPGVSNLGSEGGLLAINFQVELNPNSTDNQFGVNTDGGSLIKSERRSDA